MDREFIEREILIHDVVDRGVSAINAILTESELSSAEVRLAWVRIISSLITSLVIDRQADVTKEWMGLSTTPTDRSASDPG